jgi:hypothetical protein
MKEYYECITENKGEPRFGLKGQVYELIRKSSSTLTLNIQGQEVIVGSIRFRKVEQHKTEPKFKVGDKVMIAKPGYGFGTGAVDTICEIKRILPIDNKYNRYIICKPHTELPKGSHNSDMSGSEESFEPYIEKTNDDRLKTAKENYPVGTTFMSIVSGTRFTIKKCEPEYNEDKSAIIMHTEEPNNNGNHYACVYALGRGWANIIVKDKENNALLKKAKQQYPIGTIVESVTSGAVFEITKEVRYGLNMKDDIYADDGKCTIYSSSTDRWAKILAKPKFDPVYPYSPGNYQQGDYIISLNTYKSYRKEGQLFVASQFTSDGNEVYYEKGTRTERKNFRKAFPHEIAGATTLNTGVNSVLNSVLNSTLSDSMYSTQSTMYAQSLGSNFAYNNNGIIIKHKDKDNQSIEPVHSVGIKLSTKKKRFKY